MKKPLVYDLPTRFFHWIFTGLFVVAFFIAKVLDDDSSAYPYHMMLGFILAFVVVLRLVWGFVGSRYARFSEFDLNPLRLLAYFKEALTGKTPRQLGHNPASSWAALVMMALALGLALTGYQMAHGNKEAFEDIHELMANAFLVVAIGHVAGVIFHTLRHRDPIGLSMISGQKNPVAGEEGIKSSHPLIGVLFLVFVGVFAVNTFKNYDATNRRLNFFGTTLDLGESESEEGDPRLEQQDEDEDD